MARTKYHKRQTPQLNLQLYLSQELQEVQNSISSIIDNSIEEVQSTVDADKRAISLSDHATTTGAPGAGGAGALPATPAGYVWVVINGNNHLMPYY
jgi:hypothetical protein